MKSFKMPFRGVLLATILLLSGCSTIFPPVNNTIDQILPEGNIDPVISNWEGPRVFSIGSSPSLSFAPDRPLIIPIEGVGLMGDSENELLLSLDATYPLSEQDYDIQP